MTIVGTLEKVEAGEIGVENPAGCNTVVVWFEKRGQAWTDVVVLNNGRLDRQRVVHTEEAGKYGALVEIQHSWGLATCTFVTAREFVQWVRGMIARGVGAPELEVALREVLGDTPWVGDAWRSGADDGYTCLLF